MMTLSRYYVAVLRVSDIAASSIRPDPWSDVCSKIEVVQYIIQSEAGFYMKGVRLTAGSVQKMSPLVGCAAGEFIAVDFGSVSGIVAGE